MACVEAGAVSVSSVGLHLRPGVKEHYLGWLSRVRPDLLATYEQRYGRRAYLPPAEQRTLAARVQRLVARAEGPSTSAFHAPVEAGAVESPNQLGLNF